MLLVSITRIVVSTLVSHGDQNERLIVTGRKFVAENRALIIATFKRKAKIGGVSFDDGGVDIDELVDLFTVLINFTGFMEVSHAKHIIEDLVDGSFQQDDDNMLPLEKRSIFT